MTFPRDKQRIRVRPRGTRMQGCVFRNTAGTFYIDNSGHQHDNMFRINDFRIICEDAKRDGAFSEGDVVAGLVSFNLSKETKVKSVSVKLKGSGQVYWSEGIGEDERSYSASKRYLKVKEYLVVEKTEGSVLPQGTNQFKFRLQIPQEDLPSSFTGINGSIVYKVEAQICRKWHLDTTVQKEIQFLSKSIRNTRQAVCPQSNSVREKIGVFSKGEVQMTASVNRSVCSPAAYPSEFDPVPTSTGACGYPTLEDEPPSYNYLFPNGQE